MHNNSSVKEVCLQAVEEDSADRLFKTCCGARRQNERPDRGVFRDTAFAFFLPTCVRFSAGLRYHILEGHEIDSTSFDAIGAQRKEKMAMPSTSARGPGRWVGVSGPGRVGGQRCRQAAQARRRRPAAMPPLAFLSGSGRHFRASWLSPRQVQGTIHASRRVPPAAKTSKKVVWRDPLSTPFSDCG